MTEQTTRQLVSGLSVLALSALSLAASWIVVVREDLARVQARAAELRQPGVHHAPPVAGLRPVSPAPRKTIVVVRRSKAS